MAFTPSIQQQAIFDVVSDRQGGNIIIEAVAGSGKTTTLVKALELMSGNIFLGAYNSKMAKELKERTGHLANVRAGTFHSAGFNALRYAYKDRLGKDINDKKVINIIDHFVEEGTLAPVFGDIATILAKTVSMAKQRGIGALTDIADVEAWEEMIDQFGLTDDLPEWIEISDAELASAAIKVLAKSNAMLNPIDFDDMVYLPLVFKLRLFPQDWVLIDEAQDTNPTRRALAERMLKPGGRVIAVGDKRQAIYGFCHPAGEPVKTSFGFFNIEEIKPGYHVLAATTSGEVYERKVLQTHTFEHDGDLLTVSIGEHTVRLTPHHKIPVRFGANTAYYTYLMERDGVFRVGHCAAYTEGGFMLNTRLRCELAQKAWLLQTFTTKQEAVAAENVLLKYVKGRTFSKLTDAEVAALPAERDPALGILKSYGRMYDFPLIDSAHDEVRRISRTGAFVTEACNLTSDMLGCFYSDARAEGGKRGRRQKFEWQPLVITREHFTGTVYGITVEPVSPGPRAVSYPLYFGGTGQILVHNTGADNDALDQIAKRFNCARMPLTVSYRCPQAVVAHARNWVSHITAAESAPEGSFTTMNYADLNATVKPGDMVLCRFNKYLVASCFSLIRQGTPARIEGRAIGADLVNLINKWKITSIDALEGKIDAWMLREVKKAMAKEDDQRAARIADRGETVKVLIERARELKMTTIAQLAEMTMSMFDDRVVDKKDMVTLCSVHRSKGLENPRVFVLGRGELMGRSMRRAWQSEQEINLIYVAVTRAQEALIEVVGVA